MLKKIVQYLSKLKTKLILSFALILIVPSLIIGTLSYLKAKDTVEDQINESINENINLLNATITDAIKPHKENINMLSQSINAELYKGKGISKLNELFSFYGKVYSDDVELTYIGTESGLFVQYPDEEMDAGYDPRERPWYKDAMKNPGQVMLSTPYISSTTGNMVVTISQTTSDNSGVVAIDISLKHLQELIEQVKIGDHGYVVLLDQSGNFIYHPDKKAGSQAKETYYKKMYDKNSDKLNYVLNGKKMVMSYVTNETTNWKVGGNISKSEINDAAKPIYYRTILVIVSFLVIGGAVVYIILWSIIRPIKSLSEKAIHISKGNLSETIEVKSNDEIGKLSLAMKTMQETLRDMIQKLSHASEKVANHSEELTQSSNEVSTGTEQISSTMEELASGAERQANYAGELSSTMDEFSNQLEEANQYGENIRQSSDDVLTMTTEGSRLMKDSAEQMQQINMVVKDAVQKVERLSTQSKEISKLVVVIKDIADQTNLLALNAAIEAARAGEHGKGFSVVADEVRKLAEQVADSIADISNIVNNIQTETLSVTNSLQDGFKEVEQGSNKIQSTEKTFYKINDLITEEAKKIATICQILANISEKGEEMKGSIQEIASISEESAAGIEETAAASQQTNSSMQEVSASAEELASLAEELIQIIGQFRL